MAHPAILLRARLAAIISAILCKKVSVKKLSRKDYLLSSVTGMKTNFKEY